MPADAAAAPPPPSSPTASSTPSSPESLDPAIQDLDVTVQELEETMEETRLLAFAPDVDRSEHLRTIQEGSSSKPRIPAAKKKVLTGSAPGATPSIVTAPTSLRRRPLCIITTIIGTLFVLALGLEWTRLQSSACMQPLRDPKALARQFGLNANAPSCVPRVIDSRAASYPTHHRFYELLQQHQSRIPAPVFQGDHQSLCDEVRGHREGGWAYCLPISGRKDEPYCNVPDRMDLLTAAALLPSPDAVATTPTTPPNKPPKICFGSALHMLMMDVYAQFEARRGYPALLYGTLLGGIRNGSTIPFTEDADIGYQLGEVSLDEVREALWDLGYHMFKDNIWRVCVAPTHPLAAVLYDPKHQLNTAYRIPYVDLYSMNSEKNGTQWRVDEAKRGRRIPADKFLPYSQVRLNGVPFNTVADPIDFLIAEYGNDYMIPKPRFRRSRHR